MMFTFSASNSTTWCWRWCCWLWSCHVVDGVIVVDVYIYAILRCVSRSAVCLAEVCVCVCVWYLNTIDCQFRCNVKIVNAAGNAQKISQTILFVAPLVFYRRNESHAKFAASGK